MSRFNKCPTCGHKASGGFFGGVYINLHRCRRKGHWFCERCKNGDLCPNCGAKEISWRAEQAYRRR